MLPKNHTIDPGHSRRGILEPDATLIGTHPATRLPTACSSNTTAPAGPPSSEPSCTLRPLPRRRLEHSRFAACGAEPAVIFLLTSEAQLDSFVRDADRHLTAWLAPNDASPEHRTFPGREQIAFTSRDRLAAGDWTMLQVPPWPPAMREAGGDELAVRQLEFR